MKPHALALALVIAVASAACGGRQAVFEPGAGAVVAGVRDLELPDPPPAAPAYVARVPRRADGGVLEDVARTPGVSAAAAVAVRTMRVRVTNAAARLRIGFVDPLAFRPVAPAATRDAEYVWTALLAGEAVMSFDAARRLGVGGPESLRIGRRPPVRVAAYADNGSPNLADILVARHVFGAAPSARMIVVGAASGTTLEGLARALRRRIPGVQLDRIGTRDTPQSPDAAGGPQPGLLGAMSFRVLGNGFIEPDPAWVAMSIATGDVPLLGTVRCHRLMFPQLRAALAEVAERGLGAEIDEYGGCFVPRFIDRDPSKSLSMHAFGLAVDLNVSSNALGTAGDMHPEVVAIFERWGFEWGGRWSRPDPMHFELDRLITP